MNTSIEDRLRAHYAERTDREPLPDPDTDESLARVLARTEGSELRVRQVSSVRRFPTRTLLLAAAVLAVLCTAAGVVVARVQDDNTVSTDDDRPGDVTTTTVPPTTAPSPSTSITPGSTAPPALPGAGRTIVVSRDGALGWWDGTRWVGPDYETNPDGGVPVVGGEEYQIVSFDGPITTATGGLRQGCFLTGDDSERAVDVGIDQNWPAPSPIAVSGVANPQPRPVRILDPTAETYLAAATEVLAGLGITDPNPTMVRVVGADLDGDGTDEVVVVAERISDPNLYDASPNDYSVVFVRRIVAGSVTTKVIESSVAGNWGGSTLTLEAYGLAAIADLNGDGRMEVAVGSRYYEGAATNIHELRTDGSLVEVLSAGCGS